MRSSARTSTELGLTRILPMKIVAGIETEDQEPGPVVRLVPSAR
jgi:hypothetical protein